MEVAGGVDTDKPVMVVNVEDGSPLHGQIKEGDIVWSIDGVQLQGLRQEQVRLSMIVMIMKILIRVTKLRLTKCLFIYINFQYNFFAPANHQNPRFLNGSRTLNIFDQSITNSHYHCVTNIGYKHIGLSCFHLRGNHNSAFYLVRIDSWQEAQAEREQANTVEVPCALYFMSALQCDFTCATVRRASMTQKQTHFHFTGDRFRSLVLDNRSVCPTEYLGTYTWRTSIRCVDKELSISVRRNALALCEDATESGRCHGASFSEPLHGLGAVLVVKRDS